MLNAVQERKHCNRLVIIPWRNTIPFPKLIGDHFGVDVKRNGDHPVVGIILGSIWGSFRGLYRPLLQSEKQSMMLFICSHNIQIQPGLKAKVSLMSIVYSNKIQNRVMLSGEGNENWQKKSVGLISKKTEQLCTCNTLSHAFLCRCFARPQRDFSRKFLGTRFMEEMLYVFQFTFLSLPLIYTLMASSFSHFLTAAINEIGLLFFSSLALPLSLLSTSKKTLKLSHVKERIGFVVRLLISLKVRVAEMQNFTPA